MMQRGYQIGNDRRFCPSCNQKLWVESPRTLVFVFGSIYARKIPYIAQ